MTRPDPAHPRERWWGPVLGVVTLLAGLAAAEVVVGFVRGSASPVVPVGQVFIDVVPAWLKTWAIETFGDDDKTVLIAGSLVVLAVIGVGVGMLAVRGHGRAAYGLTVATGVIGAWAVLTRPEPSLGKLAPSIVGTGVSIAVLWRLTRPAGAEEAGPAMGVDRRRFVTEAVGIGSVAVIAGGVGRLLQRSHEVNVERSELVLPRVPSPEAALPDGVELGVDGITPFVTPNSRFYRIDTALRVPQVSRNSWRLRVHGLVERELELDFDDLLARPQMERYLTLSCVSNPVGGDLVGNARWQGVSLADLLRDAGPLDGAEQVVSRSIDGWTAGSPFEVIMDGRDAMIVYAMNGEALPARHGYPVRLVVPGLYGYVSATKWLTEIELTRWDDFDAYWVPRGWSKLGPVKTMARIDTDRRTVDGEVIVAGVAWAVHRGVSAVEVRVDEGEWQPATLGAVPSDDTWVQWMIRLNPPSGRHLVEARAIDGDGNPQPEERAPVAPNGAQGYPRRTIDV